MTLELSKLNRPHPLNRVPHLFGRLLCVLALLAMLVDYRGVRPCLELEPIIQFTNAPALLYKMSG